MPRLGTGMPLSAGLAQEAVVTIEDFVWELVSSGNITPLDTSGTISDTSNIWDYDSTDIMVEEDPEDEGFWEESYPDGATLPELVLNGDYEELGSDLVTNGDFSSDTWWQKSSANVNISNGKGNYTAGTTEYFYKTNTLTVGKQYKLVFEITDYTTGYISAFGGNWSGAQTAVGTYEIYFKCVDTTFGLVGNTFVGSIDNVSVKQVDPNDRWVLGTGWSIEDGKLKGDGTNTDFQSAQQNNVTTVGDTYEVTVTVEATSGSVELKGSGMYTRIDTLGVGTHTFYIVADATYIRFLAHASATITLDNFTVREYAIQPQNV